jgi:hypothetical protein
MSFRVSRTVLAFIVLLTAVFSSACSSLNTRTDYWPARDELRRNYPENALAKLPKNEKGTFIDLMERTYLSLLTGNPDIDPLLRYSKKIDNQVRYKVSKEIKSLFFIETPEGYYASEHEIIWMHMLLSWGFSLRHDYESACVEAKIASNLIASEWSHEGAFDDPFMRIVLGSLWAMAGDWENARVDFRAAHKLDNKLKWALILANMDSKPERLVIILGGTGPEPRWNPKNDRSGIRGYRNIAFDGSGLKSDLRIREKNGRPSLMHKTPDSSPWYVRHFERNNSINEVISDTKYAQKAIATGVEGAIIISAGVVIGVAVITGGIGLGAGLIYLAIEAESEGLASAGILVISGGCKWGASIISDSAKTAESEAKSNLDESTDYRYVRFLPEYAWINWTGKPQKSVLHLYRKTKDSPALEIDITEKLINGVYIGFFADSK